jgi:starch-binding outer membrane protein SusE/F
MKKIFLSFLFIFGLAVLQSCEKDSANQSASVVNNISLVSPTANSSVVLNPNLYSSPATTIKWTSADFGYSASVKYVLEIVKATDNFDAPQIVPLGTFNENTNSIHELAITTTVLNLKLKNLGVLLGSTSGFKMRVFGQPSAQLATSENGVKSYSQEVVINSNVYDPLDETTKLFVPGNFGAASTYADWDFNDAGTGNSPLIYAPANDNKYSGFIWMNTALPEFKFGNPGPATQKGKGATAGTLIANGANILIPAGTPTNSGAGTYYVTANWTTDTYTVNKTRVALNGPAVGGFGVNLDMTYDTNPSSPYFRMYTKTTALSVGALRFIVTANGVSNFGTFSGQGENIVPNTKNKIKLAGGIFTSILPGNYIIVLDLKNSANYNLRVISN